MNEKDLSTSSVELIDEQTTFTLVELCRSCAVEAELIEDRLVHFFQILLAECPWLVHRSCNSFQSTARLPQASILDIDQLVRTS